MKQFDLQKIPNILIIILFLVVITTFLWGSLLPIEDAYKSENRELASMPEITWDKSIFKIPAKFGTYIADQFPLRYHLVRLSHRVRYYVFQENFISTVIVGEDGWLYMNNRRYKDICQNAVNWGNFDEYTEAINTTNQFLEERGIEFAVAFIPEKCHVYTNEINQILPDLDRRYSTIPLIDHLSSTSDATVISLFDALNAEKDAEQLYFKNDTHWNSIGAYLGYQELISGLLPESSSQELMTWNYHEDVRIQEREGDLGRNTGLPAFIFETAYPPDSTVLELVKGDKNEIIYENPEADNDLTLVVFHDSFFRVPPVSEYLATHFKRTIYLNHNWGHKWSNNPETLEKLIAKWDPDIILVAHIERNIKLFIRE